MTINIGDLGINPHFWPPGDRGQANERHPKAQLYLNSSPDSPKFIRSSRFMHRNPEPGANLEDAAGLTPKVGQARRHIVGLQRQPPLEVAHAC